MTKTTPTPEDHKIVVRNIDFGLEDPTIPKYWHSDCPGITNYLNALSVLFPEGETFFIDSARPYAKDIEDPKLRAEIKGFMTQEALHTREHVAYNDMLVRQGYPADKLEARLKKDLDMGRKMLPKSAQLAITCSLEHWTATMANALLCDPEALDGADPRMANVWRWHAVEETEHKAVCYDLYQEAVTKELGEKAAYRQRIRSHIMVALPFQIWTFIFWLQFMKAAGELGNMKAWWNTFRFLWLRKNSVMRRVTREWFHYFRKDFHPWDHDNKHFIEEWDAGAESTSEVPEQFKPQAA
ncbi:unnamed protein product [Symbiodinium microadriaticum]|nr:unnamed protein product [Symbiodinium microadriaticum]